MSPDGRAVTRLALMILAEMVALILIGATILLAAAAWQFLIGGAP